MRFAGMALGLCLLPAIALAQDSKARAEALFTEAKALMAKGDYANACPKLARSQQLDPAAGTLLNLGSCYEHAGKSASAWASYKQAAAAARNLGQTDREKFARDRAQAIEPNLGSIKIVTSGSTTGMDVKLDGAAIDSAELGIAIPVDAGSHRIEASATGKKKFQTAVDVKDGTKSEVAIPELEKETSSTATPNPKTDPKPLVDLGTGNQPPPPAAEPTPKKGPWIAVGIGGMAVGAAGIAIGSIFGVMALDTKSSLDVMCGTLHDACPPNQKSAIDELNGRATVSTIALVAGGVLFAVGGTVLAITVLGGKSKTRVGLGTIEGTF